jgi:hypothetical protein
MRVLITAYFEFVKSLRDIKMFIFLVITPIVTTFILGTAVENYFSNDTIKRILVGYVNKDSGVVGQSFNKFIQSEDIGKRLKLVNFYEKAEGESGLDKGNIEVLIYLSKDLTESLKSGDKKDIQLYGKKNVEFVESIVAGYTSTFNASNATISIGGSLEVEAVQASNITRIFYTKDKVTVRAIDYYAVLVLLQMLILGAIFGVFITSRSYDTDIHIRIHSLPVRKETLILGKVIGSVAYLFIASTITILSTKFLHGVNWNGNPIVIASTVLAFCIIVVGIGVVIGLLIPNLSAALMTILLIMIFFGAFSGSISPAYINDKVSFLIPNYHAKVLLFGTIYGYSKEVMLESALGLLAIMTVIYITAVIVIRRNRYDNI